MLVLDTRKVKTFRKHLMLNKILSIVELGIEKTQYRFLIPLKDDSQ